MKDIKVYTSYFYQIRHFPPNAIAMSTAMWDPKWFHNFQGQNCVFQDKRGVVNGLRARLFVPSEELAGLCYGACPAPINPLNCEYLREYAKQLKNIDINELLNLLPSFAERIRSRFPFEGDPIFIFLVHEAPWKKCSERRVIQDYFNSNGVKCEEWQKS